MSNVILIIGIEFDTLSTASINIEEVDAITYEYVRLRQESYALELYYKRAEHRSDKILIVYENEVIGEFDIDSSVYETI